jgi:hypothetical protein
MIMRGIIWGIMRGGDTKKPAACAAGSLERIAVRAYFARV